MRFIANGPSIPDELLLARDEGRVVFFCGAGVSRAKAGLPDFFGLVEAVARTLGERTHSNASGMRSNRLRDLYSVSSLPRRATELVFWIIASKNFRRSGTANQRRSIKAVEISTLTNLPN